MSGGICAGPREACHIFSEPDQSDTDGNGAAWDHKSWPSGANAWHVNNGCVRTDLRSDNDRATDAMLLMRRGDTRSANPIAVRAVVTAMREHSDRADVQQCGCVALAVAVACGIEGATSVAAAGGIEVVVIAMRAHVTHREVQRSACRVLVSLAGVSAAVRMRAIQASAIEAAAEAVRQATEEPLDADLQCLASYTLRCLVAGSAENWTKATTALERRGLGSDCLGLPPGSEPLSTSSCWSRMSPCLQGGKTCRR